MTIYGCSECGAGFTNRGIGLHAPWCSHKDEVPRIWEAILKSCECSDETDAPRDKEEQ
jgi:hypothetical protein